MRDISFFVFTNEKYINLLHLTLPFLSKNTKHLQRNINIVSNKIPDKTNLIIESNIKYIDSSIDFTIEGSHFAPVLLDSLTNHIKEDYILFLCDDYLIKSPIKQNIFNSIINIIVDNDIDYLALGTQKHMEFIINNWKSLNIDYLKYNIPSDCRFYEFDPTTRHMYSVQPCIWKKSSLIELLKYNPDISLHELDNTDIKNKKGNKRKLIEPHNFSFYESIENFFDFDFKNYCYHYPPFTYHVDEKNLNEDYFFIDYIEIVRHGKFITFDVNSKIFLDNIINSMPDIKTQLKFFY